MSSLQMNERQMIATMGKCGDYAEEKHCELTFNDSIEFIEQAMFLDFHGEEIDKFIETFVNNKLDVQ